MLPDQVSNPGPRTYESGALPIALRGPARPMIDCICLRHICPNHRGQIIKNLNFINIGAKYVSKTIPVLFRFYREKCNYLALIY